MSTSNGLDEVGEIERPRTRTLVADGFCCNDSGLDENGNATYWSENS